MNNLKITIITACYNSEKTIKDTIESVFSQNYKNYEYIIMDGGSNDNTLNIINEYKKIKLISKKDEGLYDALNTAIEISTGDIIGIINADDVLYDNNVFNTVIENYEKDTEIIYANIKYYNNDFSEIIRDYISGKKTSNAWCPAHPSMYIRKEVFNKIGFYNLNYKIAADYDFMVRCNINNIRYKYINKYFVKMRYGGASNGIKGYLLNFKECFFILKRNKIPFPFINTFLRSLHTIKQLLVK